MTDLDRLRRQLGGPETGRLLHRLRRRLTRGQPLTGTLSLDQPSPDERRAVEGLLGRPPGRGSTLTVNLDELDQVVRRSGMHPAGLAAAVEALTGTVTVLADVRAAEAAAWRAALAPLSALGEARAELAGWCADPGTATLLRRLAGTPDAAARLAAELVAVLGALPASGEPLTRLAARTTDDAHALDPDRPLATLVRSAIRATWWGGEPLPESAAMQRRMLWYAVGVTVDELSSTVLAVNLPTQPGCRLHTLAGPAAALGEPVVLTLRQLTRDEPTFTADEVYACENPTVLAAAADELGPACPPLVCVGGQPTTAALRLLTALTAAGAQLRYHGDFDWGGLRIANLLHARLPWRPWRYRAEDYLAALTVHGSARPLPGSPVDAAWDPELAAAMQGHRVRVEEELVLDDLLADLSGFSSA
ncbi:TIGR02679 family protein [Micromonospora sp. DR5-3]|uniref:TIGR02679 family protein n=1 Tax=unclassified Micromonospora TaxID=2617518 RepID=UPI0011D7A216|nr:MULTISPECIES: TIGR02679 family protein [unclassified Micromonospora]MCW3817982.1 TIGR02679 family protein [Micromonospora sp. DR5-3]TYC19059.1 TIGR02679 family protein [Micromonospora sp. MP36]